MRLWHHSLTTAMLSSVVYRSQPLHCCSVLRMPRLLNGVMKGGRGRAAQAALSEGRHINDK